MTAKFGERATANPTTPSRGNAGLTFSTAATPGEVNLMAVFTLTIWLACLIIGLVGLTVAYPGITVPTLPSEPPVVEQLQVDLTKDLVPPLEEEIPPPDPLVPPVAPELLTAPPIAQAIAVAQPSPAIAFALPVEGARRTVDFKRAGYASPASNIVVATTPQPQTLTYGQGEGKQSAPDYPLAARRQGQEGTVGIRLTVGVDGRVLAAEAVKPSPWPLLNDAALLVVRNRWKFREGPQRIYEVAIRFTLSN